MWLEYFIGNTVPEFKCGFKLKKTKLFRNRKSKKEIFAVDQTKFAQQLILILSDIKYCAPIVNTNIKIK